MSSNVKKELASIIILVLFLGLGFGYITHRSNGEKASVAGPGFAVEPVIPGSLEQMTKGRDVPMANVRDIVTQRPVMTRFDATSLVIPLTANSCIQRQVDDLRRIQALQDSVGGDVPVHAIFFGDRTEASIRYQVLLARKAVRPTFDLWYVNEVDSLERSFLEEGSSLVLLVKNQQVEAAFHPADYKGIFREISAME